MQDSAIPRRHFAMRLVLPVAAGHLLLQLAFANGYGYHRDELYSARPRDIPRSATTTSRL